MEVLHRGRVSGQNSQKYEKKDRELGIKDGPCVSKKYVIEKKIKE